MKGQAFANGRNDMKSAKKQMPGCIMANGKKPLQGRQVAALETAVNGMRRIAGSLF
jgi:hypothetical protein